MYEVSPTAAWTIVGPDGVTVILDGSAGFYVEDVVGWDDGPPVRSNVEDLPEDDGGVAGDAFYSARAWTMQITLASFASAAARNVANANLQRALRALRADLTVKSQPQGLPAMQAAARLDGIRRSARTGVVKSYLVSLTSPDPRAYSQTLNTLAATLAPVPGAHFPWSFPIHFGGVSGASASTTATNAGNFPTPPVLVARGPVTDPQFRNSTTNEWLYVDDLALATGETLTIDVAAKTVEHSNGLSYFDRLRFPGSAWWHLPPGASLVEMWGTDTGPGTELDVTWRDAWA